MMKAKIQSISLIKLSLIMWVALLTILQEPFCFLGRVDAWLKLMEIKLLKPTIEIFLCSQLSLPV